MTTRARYDGVADWYEREFRASPLTDESIQALRRFLGEGPGSLVDVGCGTGIFSEQMALWGWEVRGVDISEDMLRLARERDLDVTCADATDLPFDDDSFDAAVSMWTHTDVDAFGAMTREVRRVLRDGGPFVYIGAHPCFVGPHSRFVAAKGVPELHLGYRRTERYVDAPGITPAGLRFRVGATHLPLGAFLEAFFAAGFHLQQLEESGEREYPHMISLRCRTPMARSVEH
jgi:SAM-dependent methyltransferase